MLSQNCSTPGVWGLNLQPGEYCVTFPGERSTKRTANLRKLLYSYILVLYTLSWSDKHWTSRSLGLPLLLNELISLEWHECTIPAVGPTTAARSEVHSKLYKRPLEYSYWKLVQWPATGSVRSRGVSTEGSFMTVEEMYRPLDVREII